jgi:lipopolysaccharide export system protein LptA
LSEHAALHAASLKSGRPPAGLGLLALMLGLAVLPAATPAQTAAATAIPTTGVVSIESDLQQADNVTGVITATGNVRIVYPDRQVVATARQAQYFTREGRVVLSGDVDVIQLEGPSIQADRITYLVAEERVIAEPADGQQVLSRFPVAPLRREAPAAPPP